MRESHGSIIVDVDLLWESDADSMLLYAYAIDVLDDVGVWNVAQVLSTPSKDSVSLVQRVHLCV